ncbi:MAG: methylmalonyl-CoA mutase family protein, partial [Alphaproteobacteria bacterium]|nr:methylmalonyl-CoA mutase family protein [Alphaproteobacteria bacterium]
SLRLQQILAYETDLLEFEDIFDGSDVIEAKVDELKEAAREELKRIDAMGGAVAAVDSSYMKQQLVISNTERLKAIETGDQKLVGVNCYTDTAPSPLTAAEEGSILTVDESAEKDQIEQLKAWREGRDQAAVDAALATLREAAQEGRNIMPPSIEAAKAGVTTGEWGQVLREVFGEYRAPTGVGRSSRTEGGETTRVQEKVNRVSNKLGRRIKMLVGKPGLDGHSNGAEQIAVKARDCGMEVVYEGIRLTPAQIVGAALEEGVHVVGLSILSGSHVALVRDIMERMRDQGLGDIPVVVGGIIPPEDAEVLKAAGVAAVYTPKDYQLSEIMDAIVDLVDNSFDEAA